MSAPHPHHNPGRRLFLKQSLALGGLATLGGVAAQSTGSYKALVCVFLTGGNDAFNTVLATDDDSWAAYSSVRSSLALTKTSLLALNPVTALANSRTVALHPQLTGLQGLFNTQRRLAIVANVGPLIVPLTKAEYMAQSKQLPAKLFSHNDQQSTWQSMQPEGATYGWGGRLVDPTALSKAEEPSAVVEKRLFSAISAAGNVVWVAGQTAKPYQLTTSGALRLGVTADSNGVDRVFGSADVATALKQIAGQSRSSHVMQTDVAAVAQRSMEVEAAIRSRMPAADVSPFGPSTALVYTKPDGSTATNTLAQQLQVVARTIAAQADLGMSKQVFFVSLGGFDTHDDQLNRQADLFAKLNHGLMYFDSVLSSLGMLNSVTTFTASDFGRGFTSNGDGTDHGWGAHHFVMGGAVQGGTVAGTFPTYSAKNTANNYFDGSPDLLYNGVMLPTTSVDQYAGTLARWFGADSTSLGSIFPNLANFSQTNLGFVA